MVYANGSNVILNPLESIDGIQRCLRGEVEVTAVWKVRGECIVGQGNVLISREHCVGDETDDRFDDGLFGPSALFPSLLVAIEVNHELSVREVDRPK